MKPPVTIARRPLALGMMQRLISRKDAVFGSEDLASLQAQIIQKLIVERAEMLLLTICGCRHAPSLP